MKELLQRLHWPREQRASFKRALTRLVETGDLIEIRGSRYGLPDRMNLVVGRVTTNPRGFGLWTPNVRLKAAPPASTSPARTSIRPCTAIVVVRVERSRDENRAEGESCASWNAEPHQWWDGMRWMARAAGSWCRSIGVL